MEKPSGRIFKSEFVLFFSLVQGSLNDSKIVVEETTCRIYDGSMLVPGFPQKNQWGMGKTTCLDFAS